MLRKFIVVLTGVLQIGFCHAQNAQSVYSFLKNNPDRAAIRLVRNGEVLANVNPDKMMTLASTMKIIVAIEYAEQVAQGTIDPNEPVSLDELEKYYIPNTDGGAHPGWKAEVKPKTEEGRVPLREVAKGMIKYSSNANTEWLIDRLGIQNVNQRIRTLGAADHDSITYLVSALLVGKHQFPDKRGEDLRAAIDQLSDEEYGKITERIHLGLKTMTINKNELGDLSMPIQRAWSDKLPASTVATYGAIMKKINDRKYFDEKVHIYLDEVMEYLLENPANRQWLEHTGMKGGSTPFVLTKAMYATDKAGNRVELAYFFNDLQTSEYNGLLYGMNDFELKILINPEFRDQIRDEL